MAEPPFIEAFANFVHERNKGFRVPNQWSAKDPSELKDLGVRVRIKVRNARLLDSPPTLDTYGFQLVVAPTDLDLLDQAAVRGPFYQECRDILKAATGCAEVRGGGHEYRNGFGGRPRTDPQGARPTANGSAGAYGTGIHSDMSAALERHFKAVVPDERHFESINIWRSTDPHRNIAMMPLALCDMRSVRPEDIVFGDGVNTGNVKQFYKVVDQKIVHDPNQRWYYFPNMTPREVLIFRQYDTRQEALNMRTVFHTAVEDPTSPRDAPMRSTIEVRMQAIYGRETNKAGRVARFLAEISDRYADGRACDWFSGPILNYQPPARL